MTAERSVKQILFVRDSAIFRVSINDLKEQNVPTPLGTKIRTIRKEKGLSLDQLAVLSETSKSYLWELENRDSANPTMDKVAKIAEKLGVTAEFLLDNEDTDPSETVADRAFFRKYQKLSAPTKQKIQDILNVISKDDPKGK